MIAAPGASEAAAHGTETAARRLRARHHERLSVRAYLLAEARGFTRGHEIDDWLAAEGARMPCNGPSDTTFIAGGLFPLARFACVFRARYIPPFTAAWRSLVHAWALGNPETAFFGFRPICGHEGQ